jgi:hypothetical protein
MIGNAGVVANGEPIGYSNSRDARARVKNSLRSTGAWKLTLRFRERGRTRRARIHTSEWRGSASVPPTEEPSRSEAGARLGNLTEIDHFLRMADTEHFKASVSAASVALG